jgi:hypothetical protein
MQILGSLHPAQGIAVIGATQSPRSASAKDRFPPSPDLGAGYYTQMFMGAFTTTTRPFTASAAIEGQKTPHTPMEADKTSLILLQNRLNNTELHLKIL